MYKTKNLINSIYVDNVKKKQRQSNTHTCAKTKQSKILLISVLVFGILFYSISNVQAAKYVRAGASGNGSDWNNAYGSLPATLTRGETYYIADGSYGSYTFNTPASGSQYITIKKATIADHGTGTGWSDGYGDGQAVFNAFTFTTGYYIIDGQTGGGPGNWTSGHGIKIYHTGDNYGVSMSGVNNITIRHVEIQGLGRASYVGQRAVYGWGGSNITFAYCWMYDMHKGILQLDSFDNVLLEFNKFGPNGISQEENPPIHGFGVHIRNNNTYTMRYNLFEDLSETGSITQVNDAAGERISNLSIYGNVFWQSGLGNVGTNYVFHLGRSNTTYSNIKIYNNTFLNHTGSAIYYFIGQTGSGNEIKNNIYYNNRQINAPFASSYNYYNSNTSNPSETGGQIATGNPFVNTANRDFHLKSATNTGATLSSPYNIDPDGKTRGLDGVWDRGAYEYGGSLPPEPMTGPKPPAKFRLVN